ncbi:MAG TPA: response regulator [Anaeromyxobacter sp.]|nr:response regulator [Anaeromyxobacter sp.]
MAPGLHSCADVSSVDGCPVVLLVDDDPDLRSAIGDALEDLGVEVIHARDGAEAIAMLRAGLRPHLALVDVMMPRMTGEQFAKAIRRWRWTLPIASMSAGEGVLSPPLVECHLRKPFPLDALERVVQRYCPECRPPDPRA